METIYIGRYYIRALKIVEYVTRSFKVYVPIINSARKWKPICVLYLCEQYNQ